MTEPDHLDEASRLLGGASSWRTHAAPSLGVPAMKLSDGPNGVRGEQAIIGATTGVAVPVGIALGATWDIGLIERVGELLGVEAGRRGAHVLLAPTVNLIRVPIGGRAFECFSEDPELTARLAVAFVRGVQSRGVAVTVKHLVGNDSEIDRMIVDVRMARSTLRELYLRPFEAAVQEAGAWGIMSAYNQLDGAWCAQNRWLLTELLREEWGFDGMVVSDWDGAHDTVAAAHAGLTLAMPGPETIFGPRLADAVRSGAVPGHLVAARVAEMARLATRTRAIELDLDRPQISVDDPTERALCRQAAISSIVLARNNHGVLPLDPSARVAVIGPNAKATRIMGGGSSSLRPLPARSILDALRDQLGEQLVGYARGAATGTTLPPLDSSVLRTPDGQPGLLLELRNGDDGEGPVVAHTVVESTTLTMFGERPPGLADRFTVTLTGEIIWPEDGPYELGAVITGAGQVTVGDTVVLDDPSRTLPRSPLIFGFGSEEQRAIVDAQAGEAVPVRIVSTGRQGGAAVRLGFDLVDRPVLIDEAVELAGQADVAVVVVGTDEEWESEGVDRTTLGLPGGQDDLVHAVAARAKRTVVVVNAGGPVTMPWIDEVDAVVLAPFAGIEAGPALAEVLAGLADPGGRLPVTYPQRLEDSPAWAHYQPIDGQQHYREGRLIGYRGHEALDRAPLLPFGHGLSYGQSQWSEPRVEPATVGADGTATVKVRVTNIGDRPVTDVVQVYLTHPHPDMPPRTLAGFAKAVIDTNGSTELEVALGPVAWRRFDDESDRWVVDPGPREVIIARSAIDEVARVTLDVESAKGPFHD